MAEPELTAVVFSGGLGLGALSWRCVRSARFCLVADRLGDRFIGWCDHGRADRGKPERRSNPGSQQLLAGRGWPSRSAERRPPSVRLGAELDQYVRQRRAIRTDPGILEPPSPLCDDLFARDGDVPDGIEAAAERKSDLTFGNHQAVCQRLRSQNRSRSPLCGTT